MNDCTEWREHSVGQASFVGWPLAPRKSENGGIGREFGLPADKAFKG